MLMLLQKYDIKDDENQEKIPYFLKELYSKSQEVGLTPQQVFDYIGDILKFSSEISISQIPDYLKKKIEEKEKLERDIEELYKKRDELTELKEKTEQEIQGLKNNKETLSKTYNSFARAKSELYKYGIGMENMDHFVKCVVGISKEGYNHFHILAKIADYENLEKDLKNYKTDVELKKDELAKLTQEVNDQRNNLKLLKIKVDIFDELEMKGFGITELRTLINMLNEIGMEHHQTFDEIRKKYFDDVKNYDEVIGSRIEIENLKKELKNLEIQRMKERQKYNAYPDVVESIIRLTGSGISEEDIVNIDKILSMNDYFLYKDKLLYKDDLINDLQKYRNLKIAIKNLEDIQINLKSTKKTQNKLAKKKRSAANLTQIKNNQ